MRTLTGLGMLGLAAIMGLLEVVALADPAGTRLANDGAPFGPPAPWYEHVLWIAVIAALAWGGVRLLNRGILGRLVRGRGLTPAER